MSQTTAMASENGIYGLNTMLDHEEGFDDNKLLVVSKLFLLYWQLEEMRTQTINHLIQSLSGMYLIGIAHT